MVFYFKSFIHLWPVESAPIRVPLEVFSKSQASIWHIPELFSWGPSKLSMLWDYPKRLSHTHSLSNTDFHSFLKQTVFSRYRNKWEAPKVLTPPSRMPQRSCWVELPHEKDLMGWHHGNLPNLIQFTQQIFVKLLLFAKNHAGCWDVRVQGAQCWVENKLTDGYTTVW